MVGVCAALAQGSMLTFPLDGDLTNQNYYYLDLVSNRLPNSLPSASNGPSYGAALSPRGRQRERCPTPAGASLWHHISLHKSFMIQSLTLFFR